MNAPPNIRPGTPIHGNKSRSLSAHICFLVLVWIWFGITGLSAAISIQSVETLLTFDTLTSSNDWRAVSIGFDSGSPVITTTAQMDEQVQTRSVSSISNVLGTQTSGSPSSFNYARWNAQGEGVIYASSGFEKPTLRAVKLGGKGDVTETHIAWEQKKGVTTQPSPILVGTNLFSITDGGVAYCYGTANGEIIWQERVGGNYSASPVNADGKIYFLSEAGDTTVIEAGAVFKVLAKNPLGEKCQASMAVSGKRLFIRTDKNLFCIGR